MGVVLRGRLADPESAINMLVASVFGAHPPQTGSTKMQTTDHPGNIATLVISSVKSHVSSAIMRARIACE